MRLFSDGGGSRPGTSRRVGVSALAALVVAAAVSGVLWLLPDAERAGPSGAVPFGDATRGPSPSATPGAVPAAERPRDGRGESAELELPDGTLIGVWEEGTLLGEVIVVGRVGDAEEIVYAARARQARPGEEPQTYVATGVRVGSRILRTVLALLPAEETAPDGMDLHGGNRLGPDRVGRPDDLPPSYLLLGAVPGELEVSVEGPDRLPRPATVVSTSVLPGHTVFADLDRWDARWHPMQLAPLVVTTSEGHRVEVRERSWTG